MKISEFAGKIFTAIDGKRGDREMIFTEADGTKYKMHHDQDCCEDVHLEDVAGDLTDLLNSPILDAREETSDKNPDGITREGQDSFTWTFYILSSVNGSVTIRWYGESNGYYSEKVDIDMVEI